MWSYVMDSPGFTYRHASTIYKDFVYGHQVGPFSKNLLDDHSRRDLWEERQPVIPGRGWRPLCSLDDRIYFTGAGEDSRGALRH